MSYFFNPTIRSRMELKNCICKALLSVSYVSIRITDCPLIIFHRCSNIEPDLRSAKFTDYFNRLFENDELQCSEKTLIFALGSSTDCAYRTILITMVPSGTYDIPPRTIQYCLLDGLNTGRCTKS